MELSTFFSSFSTGLDSTIGGFAEGAGGRNVPARDGALAAGSHTNQGRGPVGPRACQNQPWVGTLAAHRLYIKSKDTYVPP